MNFKKIINEVVDNFINEELSVSEKLIKGASYATEHISKDFARNYGNGGDVDGQIITNIKTLISFEEFGSVECYVSVINFDSKEEIQELFEKYNFGGETDQLNYRINITTMSIEEKIDKLFLYSTIYHEAEHAFQFLRKGGRLYNTTSSYNKAINVLNGKDVQHSSDEYVMVANLLYFYNKLEIEGNMNGLYGELIENGCNLNETNFKVNLDLYRNVFKDFINKYEKDIFDETLKYFGITYGKLISFVERQEEYITYRTRKIYQKAWIDLGKTVKENKKISPLGIYLNK